MATKQSKRKRIEEKVANLFGPEYYSGKRRSRLGLGVQNLSANVPRNYRACSFGTLFVGLSDSFLSSVVLSREDEWQLLRRAKMFLSCRRVDDFVLLLGLDWRREWNKEDPNRQVELLIDLFPSLKYSHESILPLTARLRRRGIDLSSVNWKGSPWYQRVYLPSLSNNDNNSLFFDSSQVDERPCVPRSRDLFRDDFVDLTCSEKNGTKSVRFDDVCRSHSIWLDPIDSSFELYKWRLRVQKSICWAYENNLVPVMMTLTIFHRWHNLKNLLNILQKSWDRFLISGRPAMRRRSDMGVEGYVRRLEITLNDGQLNRIGDDKEPVTNSGWHPHFHVILFLNKEKLSIVSDMESQLRKDWVEIVSENFKKEFGEEIEKTYICTFLKHGLHLSRYDDGRFANQLRPVKDSAYLDKIQGYDHLRAYGIDKELSSDVIKDSKIPFDLLREVSASNIDLWCEYAIATKGIPALQFSRPIIKKIDSYFEAHPEKDPAPADLPPSELIAHLEYSIYRLFYRNFLIPELKKKAAEGFEPLVSWMREKFVELGVSALCDDPTALPRPPNSVDDLLAKKILPSTR